MPHSTFNVLNPGFNIPRSYVQRVVVEFNDGFNFSQTGNVIECDYGVGGHLKMVVLPSFYDWSSNVYSAGYVWDDENSENTYPGSGGPVGFLAFVFPQIYDGNICMTIRVAFSPQTPNYFTIPGAPGDYWRPMRPF
jgi:hypothetical protein